MLLWSFQVDATAILRWAAVVAVLFCSASGSDFMQWNRCKVRADRGG